MKPRFNLSALRTGLVLLGSVLGAAANLVTYQIDMSVQTTLGNFNPGTDRVLVAGGFSNPDWIPPLTTAFVLTNDPGNNPSIYRNTFNNDVAVGVFEQHKFIIDVGSTATTLNWEPLSGNNRSFATTAGDQTLPVVYYNDISSANSLVVTQVTFSVNLGVQDTLNNFDPATDFVYVAGDVFNNNWNAGAQTLTNSVVDTNVWQGTFNLTNTVGATVNYKFIINSFVNALVWENNGVGPNSANNRQFTFTNEATTLPTVYFNNITPTSTILTNPVTFQINMAARAARIGFVPGTDSVSVAGEPLNAWSPITSPLTNDPAGSNPYLYSGTFDVGAISNSTISYKFTLNNGGSWEDAIANRTFASSNSLITLPVVFFENINNLGALSISPVTAGQVTLNWPAGPLIRLQTNAPLSGTWGDVTGTLGASTATVNVGTVNTYFRLVGP